MVKRNFVLVLAPLLSGCASSRLDLDGRSPTDVVRLFLEADTRDDRKAVRELAWVPDPIPGFEKWPPHLVSPGLNNANGTRFTRMLDERVEQTPGIYRVGYELVQSNGRTWTQYQFVRKVKGRWRIVRSGDPNEYSMPVDEIGAPPPP